MKITIVGAGNIGSQFAVHFSQKNDVIIYTKAVEIIDKHMSIVNEKNEILMVGKNIKATSNERKAFENRDMIIITYPAYLIEKIAKKIEPYANEKMKIGVIPGTGGGEYIFKNCIEKGATFFGLQRVPSVARLIEKGKKVKATGYRNELFIASIPQKDANALSLFFERTFNIKTTVLPNYLNVTLVPSNPILHTTRLKTIFLDYEIGKEYSKIPLFYGDWNNESSKLLLKCDREVQKICKSLKMFDLTYVKSLKEHYEGNTVKRITNKISNIESLKDLDTPNIKLSENRYLPDFNSRYFLADFPFGLSILVQIADLLKIKADNMKETMEWFKKIVPEYQEFSISKYGINSKRDLIDFYSK